MLRYGQNYCYTIYSLQSSLIYFDTKNLTPQKTNLLSFCECGACHYTHSTRCIQLGLHPFLLVQILGNNLLLTLEGSNVSHIGHLVYQYPYQMLL